MGKVELARVVVAGLAGDTGKSLVSLGLARALRQLDLRVAAFKKGPDFIDASWMSAAAGAPARNLDTFIMPESAVLASMASAGPAADVAVVEGNRGLFDGMDGAGSHSTAELAKLLGSPIVLVVDVTKATRTIGALVLGCKAMDPDVPLAGVILNRVGTARHEAVVREAIANATGLPVLGAIPRLSDEHLPSRHLGLVPTAEHPRVEEAIEAVARAVSQHVDLPAVLATARTAPPLAAPAATGKPVRQGSARARIGVLRDEAFSFYYPENLLALEEAGAEVVSLSPLADDEPGEIDALYAGGGFPEMHAEGLAANQSFKQALAARIADGLPVWAECGGLMYLSKALLRDGATHEMVGALPVRVEHMARPQGHGYVQARVDRENPFLATGTELRGHEFHYSRVLDNSDRVETAFSLDRGVGVGKRRDGLRSGNVLASYTHLHALGSPNWASSLVEAATRGAL